MLKAAHQRQSEGVDVVVAHVAPHGDPSTEALLQGLEVLPHAIDTSELNLDILLARHPQLILLDDLAVTNSPHGQHRKRYQDAEELLHAGIDVYATLNIQHLESLNEVIAQLTGVVVAETIPDRVLDQTTTEITFVDLPPDELLQRFREGKVHLSFRARESAPYFFRKETLTALRELALRCTAQCIDSTAPLFAAPVLTSAQGPVERLMVCVGEGILGERLIRTTRRLATALQGEWTAFYVETPGHSRLSEVQRDQIAHTLRLAESLGGKVINLSGTSVVDTVIAYAHNHAITKIIVGKSLRPRWQEHVYTHLADELIRRSGTIDIYVISETRSEHETSRTRSDLRPHPPLHRYLLGLGLVILSTLISFLVRAYISPASLSTFYLLSVVAAARYLGRGPAILVSVIGVLTLDFFFIPPSLTLTVEDVEYLLTFFGLFIVGLVVSRLAAQAREQMESTQHREVETVALYALSQDLAAAEGLEAITQAVVHNIGQTLGWLAFILLLKPEAGETLAVYPRTESLTKDKEELRAALWALKNKQITGQGTDIHPEARAYYLPLQTAQGVVGVLGVTAEPPLNLTPEQRRLLKAFALQAALAIEREQLAEAARHAQLLEATEKLQTALLNSISHDLRTPLVAITGVLSSLEDDETLLDADTRRSLVETAREEAERLNYLVGDMLNMTRIESGAMHIIWEPGDVQDAIGSALEQLKQHLEDRPITVDIPPDLPLVPMGFVLIVLVLDNVIENALKYSPPGSPIEIRVSLDEATVKIEVADRGVGIPPEDLERVFDKFYRVQRPNNVSGTGLGLSIARGIIEAHNGRIWAENRPGGGTVIHMTLPKERPDV